jgi:hypothetical protein
MPHGRVHANRLISSKKEYKSNMKIILFITGMITLLTTSGCLVDDAGGRRHGGYERHDAVVVGPPVLVVRPPEVIVR